MNENLIDWFSNRATVYAEIIGNLEGSLKWIMRETEDREIRKACIKTLRTAATKWRKLHV